MIWNCGHHLVVKIRGVATVIHFDPLVDYEARDLLIQGVKILQGS